MRRFKWKSPTPLWREAAKTKVLSTIMCKLIHLRCDLSENHAPSFISAVQQFAFYVVQWPEVNFNNHFQAGFLSSGFNKASVIKISFLTWFCVKQGLAVLQDTNKHLIQKNTKNGSISTYGLKSRGDAAVSRSHAKPFVSEHWYETWARSLKIFTWIRLSVIAPQFENQSY